MCSLDGALRPQGNFYADINGSSSVVLSSLIPCLSNLRCTAAPNSDLCFFHWPRVPLSALRDKAAGMRFDNHLPSLMSLLVRIIILPNACKWLFSIILTSFYGCWWRLLGSLSALSERLSLSLDLQYDYNPAWHFSSSCSHIILVYILINHTTLRGYLNYLFVGLFRHPFSVSPTGTPSPWILTSYLSC